MLRTPVVTGGRGRAHRSAGTGCESVEVEHLEHRARGAPSSATPWSLTGDWIPDHELARLGGLDLDPATARPGGRRVAAHRRAPGVFAVGNLVHPVDTADVAALDGRHVAGCRHATWLAGGIGGGPGARVLSVTAAAPLRWVTPQRVPAGGGAPRGQLLLWVDEYHRLPVVRALQGGVEVGRVRVPWPAAPGRVFRVPEKVLRGAVPSRGPVTLHLG